MELALGRSGDPHSSVQDETLPMMWGGLLILVIANHVSGGLGR